MSTLGSLVVIIFKYSYPVSVQQQYCVQTWGSVPACFSRHAPREDVAVLWCRAVIHYDSAAQNLGDL